MGFFLKPGLRRSSLRQVTQTFVHIYITLVLNVWYIKLLQVVGYMIFLISVPGRNNLFSGRLLESKPICVSCLIVTTLNEFFILIVRVIPVLYLYQ